MSELEELLGKAVELTKLRKLYRYKPYPFQKEFHDAGFDNQERMLMAGNRCLTPWTVIETVPEPRRVADIVDEPRFYVSSWADGSGCVAQASGVFLKGIEQAFHVQMDNGQWFQCNRRHRVLTDEGWLSLDQLVRASSGLHWTQTVADYLDSCGAGDCRDDEQLLAAGGSGLKRLPSEAGVQKHDRLIFSQADVEERVSRYTHVYPESSRISIGDGLAPLVDLFSLFPDPGFCTAALLRSKTHQEALRLQDELIHRKEDHVVGPHQSCGGVSSLSRHVDRDDSNTPAPLSLVHPNGPQFLDEGRLGLVNPELSGDEQLIETFYPCEHPGLVGGGRIKYITPIGYQPIVDFTVAETSCYLAGGVIHHNTGKTFSAAAEVAFHMTGEYPDWWEGKRFDEPVLVWIGSVTNEASRDICQKELVGGTGEALGTGAIPRHLIVGKPSMRQAGVSEVIDTIKVRHVSGGVSTGVFKTYDQGWRKWQGTAPHVVWMDEEPDHMRIFTESQTRIMTSDGILMVTFTPLLGETELVRHFTDPQAPGIWLKTATWDDAPHLKESDKARLGAAYPDYEFEARTKGIPMMGEGRVFQIKEEDIKCRPFDIPNHFARICGVDFGAGDSGHPSAAAWIAWDRDRDIIYVYDCYRRKGQTPDIHVPAINKRGHWIPVAWPHDGIKTGPADGKMVKDQYVKEGANMLSISARYDNDKGGAQPKEPIFLEVLERMRDGRFKVFDGLNEWFEEFRSFHRKDGKVVAVRDDVLMATFYAIMMKRYARQNIKPVLRPRYSSAMVSVR